MTEFLVRLGTSEGVVQEQRHRAANAEILRRELENKGQHVFSVRVARGKIQIPFISRRERISSMDFLFFNQQLATLLKAGIPVLQSLELLQRTQQSRFFRDILGRVLEDVRGGMSLSETFATQENLFPRLYCATLMAGERAGELVPVLQRFIKHQQTMEAVRRRVFSALMYPLILVCMSLALIVLLVTYVIPKFALFYQAFEAKLPLLTQIVVGLSNSVARNGFIFLGILLVGFFVIRHWIHTEAGAIGVDKLKLKIPFVGKILHYFGLSQYIRSLGTLLAGGTHLVSALEIAHGTVTNRAISAPLVWVAPRVREGQPLWSSLETTHLFPELSIAMVEVGEATGALEEMLFNVCQFYDESIETRLARMVVLIEPFVLVFMGGIVAVLLLSVYLPLFSLLGQSQ